MSREIESLPRLHRSAGIHEMPPVDIADDETIVQLIVDRAGLPDNLNGSLSMSLSIDNGPFKPYMSVKFLGGTFITKTGLPSTMTTLERRLRPGANRRIKLFLDIDKGATTRVRVGLRRDVDLAK